MDNQGLLKAIMATQSAGVFHPNYADSAFCLSQKPQAMEETEFLIIDRYQFRGQVLSTIMAKGKLTNGDQPLIVSFYPFSSLKPDGTFSPKVFISSLNSSLSIIRQKLKTTGNTKLKVYVESELIKLIKKDKPKLYNTINTLLRPVSFARKNKRIVDESNNPIPELNQFFTKNSIKESVTTDNNPWETFYSDFLVSALLKGGSVSNALQQNSLYKQFIEQRIQGNRKEYFKKKEKKDTSVPAIIIKPDQAQEPLISQNTVASSEKEQLETFFKKTAKGHYNTVIQEATKTIQLFKDDKELAKKTLADLIMNHRFIEEEFKKQFGVQEEPSSDLDLVVKPQRLVLEYFVDGSLKRGNDPTGGYAIVRKAIPGLVDYDEQTYKLYKADEEVFYYELEGIKSAISQAVLLKQQLPELSFLPVIIHTDQVLTTTLTRLPDHYKTLMRSYGIRLQKVTSTHGFTECVQTNNASAYHLRADQLLN